MNQPIDFDTLFENLCSSLSFFQRINLNTKKVGKRYFSKYASKVYLKFLVRLHFKIKMSNVQLKNYRRTSVTYCATVQAS